MINSRKSYSMYFRYFYNYAFQNGLIEVNDIEAFTEKLRKFSGWSKESKEYLELNDVNSTFYECLRDQVRAEFQGKMIISIHMMFQ